MVVKHKSLLGKLYTINIVYYTVLGQTQKQNRIILTLVTPEHLSITSPVVVHCYKVMCVYVHGHI